MSVDNKLISIGLRLAAISIIAVTSPLHAVDAPKDSRNIATGVEIPSKNYVDQPYVIVLPNGTWLCVLTTGEGEEGASSQYIQSTTSKDHGKSWSKPVLIEKPDGPEASWAMPLLTDFGRVYVFYDYNGDEFGRSGNSSNLDESERLRVDMLGWYCYRYSDDGGKSWSAKRYRLPVRMTNADRNNTFDGKVQILWGIGKPIHHDGMGFLSFSKIRSYMLDESEGWIFRSDNILTERDPEKLHWEMLPEGENPIRSPLLGSIQSEHNLTSMPNGRLACMYRTVQGHPAIAYSADNGDTWSEPEHARYSPGGRKIKHPRACPRIWKCSNGKYLFWFHNHDGKGFIDRNPAWVIGGVAKEGILHWSEPEILLYLDNPRDRTSYPDLIEQDNKYWITETQKSVARVHEIDSKLLEGLWAQVENTLPDCIVTEGRVGDFTSEQLSSGKQLALEEPLSLEHEGSFTIEIWATINHFLSTRTWLDARDKDGKGWAITPGSVRARNIQFGDGEYTSSWATDPYALKEDALHHIVFVVDGGPNIVSIIIDGKVCDGGDYRQFGWSRFSTNISDLGSEPIRVGQSDAVTLHRLRVYNRYLRTSEIVQNYRAGVDGK